MTLKLVCLVWAATLLGNAGVAAQQNSTVSGTVVAAQGAAPLAGASVVIAGTARGVLTNAQGRYSLSVPPGTHTVRARLIGYDVAERRVTVAAGQTVTADFTLVATPLSLNEVVVVGARTSRTATETPVPVDVISAQEMTETGLTEVNQMLATLAPSFNASHQTIADGSDQVNPASLRGLGPDQVLVLVNGKRRYTSALVHVNGTFGRGTVGVDLNAIPAAAIERIEVLRDGASAQYGSDAIAGVINIVLKRQTEHLEVSSTVGSTPGGGAFSGLPDHHDGDQVKADANYGFAIADRGFFNVTAEYLNRGATSRAAPYSGPIWVPDNVPYTDSLRAIDEDSLGRHGLTRQDFTMRVGQSAATEGMAFYNTVVPLGETAEFYSFGGLGHRDGLSAGFFRLPNQPGRVVPQLYPFGFLPDIHTNIDDHSAAAGVRGTVNAWDVDFSVTRGRNAFHFFVDNSDNASMGAASPTTFDAGRLSFDQTVGNLDVVRPLGAWGGLRSLSFVAGAEFRREEYQIEAGEEASWQLGNGGTRSGIDFDTTSSGAPKESGAQVFPGFQPSNQVDRTRNSLSAYGGFESQVSERLLLDLGGRLEDYSDFGRTFNWKVATRFQVVPALGLRAAASTGFRAPSLGQAWFNNVSNQFVIDASGNLVPNRILTSNNESRPHRAVEPVPELQPRRRRGRPAAARAVPAARCHDRAILHQRGGHAHHRTGRRRDAQPQPRRRHALVDRVGELHEDRGPSRERPTGDGRYVHHREPRRGPQHPAEPRGPKPARGRAPAGEGRPHDTLRPGAFRRARAGHLLRHDLLSEPERPGQRRAVRREDALRPRPLLRAAAGRPARDRRGQHL